VLPASVAALGAVCAVLAGGQLAYARGGDALLIGAAGAVSAACLAVVAWAAWRRPVPERVDDAVCCLAVVTVGANAALQAVLTDRTSPLWALLLAMVAGGAVLASTRWVAGLTAGLAGLWAVAGTAVGLRTGWTDAVAGLGVAVALSAAVHARRRGDVHAAVEAGRTAEATAVSDALTGVYNSRGLTMLVAPMLESARRRGDALHCHVVDVDRFHEVSGVLGVTAANEVLLSVAEALRESTRGTDVIARLDAQEFVVVGPGAGTPPAELERRVRTKLAEHPPVDIRVWSARVTAGVAVLAPWDSGSLDALVEHAAEEMRRRRSTRQLGTRWQPAAAPDSV
jgi:diguanylate cyclase (GGDEF)-like protein